MTPDFADYDGSGSQQLTPISYLVSSVNGKLLQYDISLIKYSRTADITIRLLDDAQGFTYQVNEEQRSGTFSVSHCAKSLSLSYSPKILHDTGVLAKYSVSECAPSSSFRALPVGMLALVLLFAVSVL